MSPTIAANERRLRVSNSIEVSALLVSPPGSRALYVLAHGAGAGMRHAFMETMAQRLAQRGIGTLRYQFPYVEQGSRRIDPEPLLLDTVCAAVAMGREEAGGVTLFAGGKSMGGRMTSRACAARPLEGVAGLAFLGFPLHPAGQTGITRAEHLSKVTIPLLFLQGTRDALAELDLMRPVVDKLGSRATLHIVEHADHMFHVLKKSGRSETQVLDELADTIEAWSGTLGSTS